MVSGLFDKLSIISESLNFVVPEVLIAIAVLLLLLIDLIFGARGERAVQVAAFVFLLLLIWMDVEQVYMTNDKPVQLFLRMLQLDQIAVAWKLILDAGLLIVLCIHWQNRLSRYRAEFIVLLFGILLGAHLLVMSSNLLMVYLSIEIMSIGAYVLTTYAREGSSYEGGIKYLLFGGVSSAVMLYGMSLIYAFTGTLEFADPAMVKILADIHTVPMLVAGLMVMAGILFKISAAPLHIWTPDAYQVAPTPAVAYFSMIPKLAGFAILVKWLLFINIYGLGDIPWSKIVGGIAVLSLTVGNFSALWQTNVKRLLAYSAIAHSGFILIGLAAFSETGLKSILFYAAIYVLMNGLAFLLVNLFEYHYGVREIKEYSGLSKQAPMLTVLMVVAMIALTGLPPTAGFTAKLFIFSAVWETYTKTGSEWLIFVFAFGLINVVVSLFYYLKIPYYMIFKSNGDDKIYEVAILENYLALILVLALLAFFFRPDWLMNMINSINFAF